MGSVIGSALALGVSHRVGQEVGHGVGLHMSLTKGKDSDNINYKDNPRDL